MKNFIAFFTLTLLAVSGFAQQGIQNVFVNRTISGNQVSVEVLAAGPGRQGGHLTVLEDYEITSMDVTFYAPISSIDELDVNISMSPSSGSRWSGYASGSNATGIFDSCIITMRHANGEVTRWEAQFNLGTGTRTSSTQAGTRAELL
jgi:hypothetical protein